MRSNQMWAAVSVLVLVLGVVAWACGGGGDPPVAEPSPQQKAIHGVVEAHVEAIREADRDALAKLWLTDNAQQRTIAADDKGNDVVRITPINDAIKVWTEKATADTKASIESVDIVNDRMAFVKLKLTWNGSTYHDYLTLFSLDGEWKLAGKTYIAEAVPGRKVSPYGM